MRRFRIRGRVCLSRPHISIFYPHLPLRTSALPTISFRAVTTGRLPILFFFGNCCTVCDFGFGFPVRFSVPCPAGSPLSFSLTISRFLPPSPFLSRICGLVSRRLHSLRPFGTRSCWSLSPFPVLSPHKHALSLLPHLSSSSSPLFLLPLSLPPPDLGPGCMTGADSGPRKSILVRVANPLRIRDNLLFARTLSFPTLFLFGLPCDRQVRDRRYMVRQRIPVADFSALIDRLSTEPYPINFS